jgi:hypothetical protein
MNSWVPGAPDSVTMQLMCQEKPYIDQELAIKKRALTRYYGANIDF